MLELNSLPDEKPNPNGGPSKSEDSNYQAIDRDDGPFQILRNILNISLPAMTCEFLTVFQMMINLIIAGKLNNQHQFAGVGLGNSINTVITIGMFTGLNQTLNTFVSQSRGAGKYEQCGVYLNQARMFLMGGFLIVLPIEVFSGRLMEAIGQDAEVSYYTTLYCISTFPGIIMLGLIDLERNFLVSYERSDISLSVMLISPFLHFPLCYFLTINCGLGLYGIGLAEFVTNTVIFGV